jgi:hypothetical protein
MAEFPSIYAEETRFPDIEQPSPYPDIETTVPGVLKSVGAGLMAGATFVPRAIGAAAEVLSDITGLSHGTLGEESRKAQEFWQKKIGESKAEQLVGQAAETIGMISTVAATGGGSKVLAALSAGAGVEKTATELEAGTPRLNAYGAGFATAANEYITEKLPIGYLQKPAMGFFKRLAGGLVTDVIGEMAATAIELEAIDKGILGKDIHLTKEQYFDLMKDVAAVSTIATIGLSGGAQLAHSLQGTQPDTKTIEKAIDQATIKPSEPHISIEKTEPIPEVALDRESSKSEFPELQKQDNIVVQDSSLELTPTTEPVPDLTEVEPVDITQEPQYKDWASIMEASRAESLKKRKLTKDKAWKSFVKGFVDVSGNLQAKLSKLGNDGKRVVMRQNAIAGASTKGTKEANVAKKLIYDGMNSKHKKLFDGYMSALRHLELRANKGAAFILPENATEQMLTDYVNNIPSHIQPIFQEKAAAWSGKMDEILGIMETEGLLTNDQRQRLRAEGRYYVPRQVLDFIDPLVEQKNREGKTVSVRDSGLKNLTEDGSDKLIETDSQLLLEQVYQRAWTRVFRNRAGLELLNLSRNEPLAKDIVRESKVVGQTKKIYEVKNRETGFVSKIEAHNFADVLSIMGDTKDSLATERVRVLEDERATAGKKYIYKSIRGNLPIYEKAKPNEGKISVMENGIRKELIMPLELASEWVTGDPILSTNMANLIGYVSGNKILKAMATTLNPEFIITNIPRDLAHIYLTTSEYSSLAPAAALEMSTDLLAVAKDAFTKTGLYDTYIDNGGGMEFLSHQGKWGLKGDNAVSRTISGLETLMSKAGEFSETLTRLALMRRAMRNGKTPFEATQIARGYLDFSRGGSVSKAINSAIPFFNAGVQGTRGIARAAKTDLKLFGFKVLNIMAMATGLYYANSKQYADDYEDVPDHDKVNNWVIMTPYTYLDKEGVERRYYFRIAKDQGQRVFATIAESMARKQEGLPVDTDQIVQSVKDFVPILPGEFIPPTVEMILGYSVNKDFWTGEDIWRGEDVLPQEEYNKYTPEPYVRAGKAIGKSPVRLKYMTEQLFTRGNIFTSLVGYGAEQVFSELSPEQRNELTQDLLEKKPFLRRMLKSTRPDIKRKKEIEEEKRELNTRRLIINRNLDALAERFFNGQTDEREVREFIRRQETPAERKRVARRFRSLSKLKDVKNKGFWFDLLDLPPEQRAVNYWNQWVQLDEAGKRDLDKQSFRVPGFRSKRFNRTLIKMKRFGSEVGR